MSLFGDMSNKGRGESVKSEDISAIYYDDDSAKNPIEVIKEESYKEYRYMICTNGKYPVLDIRGKNDISIFSGYDTVILQFDDGSKYELNRMFLRKECEVKYLYEFNKDGDYIQDDYHGCTQEGHKYSIPELEKYAEKFIDKILECEKTLVDHLE